MALTKITSNAFTTSAVDSVEQFGHWFVFNNDQWNPLSDSA